jgi:hypothetical protein
MFLKRDFKVLKIKYTKPILRNHTENWCFWRIFLLLLFINGFVYSFRNKNIEYAVSILTFTISFLTELMFKRQWGILFFTLFIFLGLDIR